MSAMGWTLLERLVHLDVWARTAGAESMSPLTLVLVLALLCVLAVAIAHAGRSAAAVRAATGLRDRLRAAAPPPRTRAHRTLRSVPTGGQGPRAPGSALVG